MFDIGFSELMVDRHRCPDRYRAGTLPKVARTLGHLLGAPSVTSMM
jgi:hypothetical protein